MKDNIQIVPLQKIHANRLNSIWYGGDVAEYKTKGYIFTLVANGDVEATLHRPNGETDIYVKDRSNHGIFFEKMKDHIKTDSELYDMYALKERINGKSIEIQDNNWWEIFITTPNGQNSSVVCDSENYYAAKDEMINIIKDTLPPTNINQKGNATMSTIIILPETTKDPISLIGRCAGVCWGGDTTDPEKNYKRGMSCIKANHGRTLEFPEIYAVLDGYSARVIREWYTHIGGAPTRLQASTRYIDYDNFEYITPNSIAKNDTAEMAYAAAMGKIVEAYDFIQKAGVPKEDAALLLPLGMTTRIVDKRNLRNVMDMSRQRMCTRAYHEYRAMFNDYLNALRDYSQEWKEIIDLLMMPKCEAIGYCPEAKSCGRMPKKGED